MSRRVNYMCTVILQNLLKKYAQIIEIKDVLGGIRRTAEQHGDLEATRQMGLFASIHPTASNSSPQPIN